MNAADCQTAVEGMDVVYHAAAGLTGSTAVMFLNTVVPTRKLIDACVEQPVKRFVLVSSLGVYGAAALKRNSVLDEVVSDRSDAASPRPVHLLESRSGAGRLGGSSRARPAAGRHPARRDLRPGTRCTEQSDRTADRRPHVPNRRPAAVAVRLCRSRRYCTPAGRTGAGNRRRSVQRRSMTSFPAGSRCSACIAGPAGE